MNFSLALASAGTALRGTSSQVDLIVFNEVDRRIPQCLTSAQIFHRTFHFPGDTSGRHATPRDTMWLMLLDFPNGVEG